METGGKSSAPVRVVILARGGAVDGQGSPGDSVQFVRAGSAYEAAAEILSGPTLALVMDLSALTRRHLRLLEIARRMEVEMIGVGRLPAGMSTDELSGVRLLAPEALGASLRRLLGAQAAAGDAERPPSAVRPAAPGRQGKQRAGAEAGADRETGREAAPRAPAGEGRSPLLTPEELRALLEDEQ